VGGLIVVSAAAALLAGPASAQPADLVPPTSYQEQALPNGLKLITSVDRTTPNVTVQVWYDVGGRDDPPGRSGFAHLFEHMMFKATRDMPPELMDRLTEDVGGMNNAATMDDATYFYEVAPASDLERLIWAEAERMSALVVDKANFESERQVVEEELRQRVLADPYGRLFETLIPAHTFQVHPYHRAPIGSIANLDAASLDDVQAFHATYYRPDNAVLVVAGNFDPAQLRAWVARYFGPLTDPAAPIPRVTVREPARTGPATYTDYGPDVPLPAVVISWLGPTQTDPDAPALQVLAAILATGKSSRLYDGLVYQRQIAQQVFADADLRAQGGLFYVGGMAAPGHTVDELRAALSEEIADLQRAPVGAAALDAAKTQLLTAEIRERETIDGRANELGYSAVVEGSAARANTDIDDLAKVTAADVQRAARRYLPDNRGVVIRYLSESQRPAGAAAAPPEPPPPPSKPYRGPVAALLPPSQRMAPPPMGAQPAAEIPKPAERTLSNGLRVIVARSADLPIVSASLAFVGGAGADPAGLAGDAQLTAALVTEGTQTRTAREIAAQSEALGAALAAGSDLDSSSIGVAVMPSKLPAALAILGDVARRPTFAPDEIGRARKAALEAIDVDAADPTAIADLAVAPLAYAGTPFAHAAEGSRAAIGRLARDDFLSFHARVWRPDNGVLVLTGDITPEQGFALAEDAFGGWPRPTSPPPAPPTGEAAMQPRTIVVDVPGAGQAAVDVIMPGVPRTDPDYFDALIANAVLGGGYSARLNEEVRVKRGLSYGAGSELAAGRTVGAVIAGASTRNDAAAQVADLVAQTIASLAAAPPSDAELAARKASLIGDYGREIGTAEGLGARLQSLAIKGIDPGAIGAYQASVEAVTPERVEAFGKRLASAPADLVVVGDSKAFIDALRAHRPDLTLLPVSAFEPDTPTLTAAGR